MSNVAVLFHTEATPGSGAPIPGATIHSVPPRPGDPGEFTIQTNSEGNFEASLSPGRYHATISAPGYATETRDWLFSDPFTANPVRIGLAPAAQGLSPFKVSGNDFLDPKTNARKVFVLEDCFPAYRFWLDGRRAELDALAQDAKAAGIDGWRIFGAGAISQNFVMQLDPWAESRFYSEQKPFASWMASWGLVGLWTVNVDMQVIQTSVSRRVENFLRTCDNFRHGNMLISGGNEHDKNGFDPNENPNPGAGIVWSRGSGLSDQSTPPNGATAAEFHQRRDIPKMLDDSVASATDMQFRQGFGMLWMDEPIGFDENPSGSRSTDPWVAWKLSRVYATYWALMVYHSSAGQRGLLLGPTARACRDAWVKGSRL